MGTAAALHAGPHTIHLFGRIPDYFGPGEDFVSEAGYDLLLESEPTGPAGLGFPATNLEEI